MKGLSSLRRARGRAKPEGRTEDSSRQLAAFKLPPARACIHGHLDGDGAAVHLAGVPAGPGPGVADASSSLSRPGRAQPADSKPASPSP